MHKMHYIYFSTGEFSSIKFSLFIFAFFTFDNMSDVTEVNLQSLLDLIKRKPDSYGLKYLFSSQ